MVTAILIINSYTYIYRRNIIKMVERKKRLILPGLIFDNQSWVPVSQYPNYQVFTDKVLAGVLNVSPMRVGMWRASGVIPYELSDLTGKYAAYNVNAVLEALRARVYTIDPTLKSNSI
jgi:hypothetical protein